MEWMVMRGGKERAMDDGPWMYAIEDSNGNWKDGEQCVFGDLGSCQDAVDSLNDELDQEFWYRVVPLYRKESLERAQPATPFATCLDEARAKDVLDALPEEAQPSVAAQGTDEPIPIIHGRAELEAHDAALIARTPESALLGAQIAELEARLEEAKWWYALGEPHAFRVSPEKSRIAYLESQLSAARAKQQGMIKEKL